MYRAAILHVEDDPDDAFFVARAFCKALAPCLIQRVKDGQEAIDYLERSGRFSQGGDYLEASLVLLDLKLPGVDGFEVIQYIRSHASFANLVVVVLSGSTVEEDKRRASTLGANAYFVKTPDYTDVVAFVSGLLTQEDTIKHLDRSSVRAPIESI